jgi:hypothetical protein
MKIVEILAALAAIGSIATFLGVRAAIRRTVRSLGRKPKPPELQRPQGIVKTPEEIERRTQ